MPDAQSQQVGLQSANVEQLSPEALVPLSFSGLLGQPPLTCSAWDDTVDPLGSVPSSSLDEPLEPLLPLEPPLPLPTVASVPLHATSATPIEREAHTKESRFIFVLRLRERAVVRVAAA